MVYGMTAMIRELEKFNSLLLKIHHIHIYYFTINFDRFFLFIQFIYNHTNSISYICHIIY